MTSALWFAEFERLIAKLEDEGMSPDEAYDKAGELADGALRERLADMADYERKRRKENGQ